jgi:cytochrome c-type biogenesis protein CcmH/NrfG
VEKELMGWVAMLVLAALVGAGLWYFLRPDKGALQFAAAALLFALAGYAWQGHPGMAGAPKAAPPHHELPDSEFTQLRGDLLGRFDRASAWLTMAEGFQRRGDTRTAVEVIKAGLRDSPTDPDLWVGLGNALVVHGGGMMNPAAQYAFQRAQAIAPDHPGPRFFYGLALAQAGNFDQAERIWRQLLAEAPAGAAYRQAIEERLQALDQARAMGEIPGPAPQPEAPASAPAPAAQ